MDVGLELRQARERRGITLQRLSNTTRISPRILEAIEASDEVRLPAPVFTRGFVKSFASEVGLDPDDAARRFLEQFQKPVAADVPETTREPETKPGEMAVETAFHTTARVLHGRFGTVSILAVTTLAAIALAARERQQPPSAPAVQRPAVAAAISPPPAPQTAVGTSGVSKVADDALHMVIAPTGLCWVQATVGDTRVFGALLNAGDRRTIDSTSDVTLRVGDPSTFTFAINGKPARIAGGPGRPVTVHITRDNYARFLSN
jgi:cytoskeletal protein RodZ